MFKTKYMKYSIVIPTYNHSDDLLKPCIESIIQNTKKTEDFTLNVIIVANGCTDNTKEYIEELKQQTNKSFSFLPIVIYDLWFDKPLGYTKATNAGIKKAIELGSDYTILMNNDVVLVDFANNNNWLDMLIKPFNQNPSVGMCGTSRIIDEVTQRDFIIFYMAMIKTSIFNEVGLLDEVFNPGFGEDIDFSIKLQNAGYEIARVPVDGVGYDYSETFPLIHGAEKTMHDKDSKIKEIFGLTWDEIVVRNQNILKERYIKPIVVEQSVMENDNKIKYSIIIPTTGEYKGKLDVCLETMLESTDLSNKDIEIIVVANGVTEDTKKYLNTLIKRTSGALKTIYYDRPEGYPLSTNAGIYNSKGDYIVLLNDDVIFLEHLHKNEWLEALASPFTNKENVGIVGLKTLDFSFTKESYFMFFCIMISRKLVETIGVLNEDFSPAFVEDEEYCYRATKAGFNLIEIPKENPNEVNQVRVYHKSSATLNNFEEKRRLVKRNRHILLDKYFPNDIVNIVIATHNRHLDLRKALESIEEQTYQKIRVWVCADGHDDVVQNIVSEFQDMSEHKVYNYLTLYEHEGLFGSKPRMLGLQTIPETGVVCFVDDDNVIYSTYIEKLFNALRSDEKYGEDEVYVPDSNIISYCVISHNLAPKPIPQKGHTEGVFEFSNIDTLNVMINSYVAKQNIDKWQHIKDEKVTHDFNFIKGCSEYGKSVFVDELLGEHRAPLSLPKKPVKKSKIYDCFMFHDELDILDIRFNELYPYVDKFVLSEARFTHQGNPKPLHFLDNKERYNQFLDKIEHIIVDEMPTLDSEYVLDQKDKTYFKDGNMNWIRERYQRDMVMKGLINCDDDDIIIISDVDEIINPEVLTTYKPSMGYQALDQRMFYYKLNCEIFVTWPKARIMPYGFIKDKYPSDVRIELDYEVDGHISNAGWHFSYLYNNPEQISNKIQSFCDAEMNTEKFTDIERIKGLVENAEDLYDRPHKMNYVDLDSGFPKYVLDNELKFIEIGLIKPMKVSLNIDKDELEKLEPFTYSEIFTDNVYCMEEAEVKGATIIDIGANYGFFALRALELGAKNVYCFEPEENNYNKLVELTKDIPEIKNYKVAILDGSVSKVHMVSKTVESTIYGDKNDEKVNCISLVEALGSVDPEDDNLVLKLDCEGSEFEILLHTPQEVLNRFSYIYLEIHDDMNPNFKYKSKLLLSYLNSLGFDVATKGPQAGVWYNDGSFIPSPVYVYKMQKTREISTNLTRPPIVYDCFMFNDELDVLDVRLDELDEVVDVFVIVESELTHSGKPKPLHFAENKERYKKYAHKIRYYVFNDMPETDNAWHRESNQRDACIKGLYDAQDYDIIISGDADEIPRKGLIEEYKNKSYDNLVGVVGVETKYYFYFLNCERQDKGTTHLRLLPYHILKNRTFCYFRYKEYPIIENGGWHFSFIGDVKQIQKKFDSYAHQEYNTDYYTNTERLTKMINNGEDILEKGMTFNFVSIDEKFPKYIQNNIELLDKYIKPVDKPKVYDTFSFFNELDLLDIRLNVLDDVVDVFVICESSETHSGKAKPLYLYNEIVENPERYAKFKDKIILLCYDGNLGDVDSWVREKEQRNYLKEGLLNCNDNDIIMVSDADEIPSIKIINELKTNYKEPIQLLQKQFYYYLNEKAEMLSTHPDFKAYPIWTNTRLGKFSDIKHQTMDEYRRNGYYPIIEDGWHFSYLGGTDKIIHKLESFAHVEFSGEEYKDKEKIQYSIDNGLDIFGRPYKYKFIDIDDTYPPYIIENKELLTEKGLIYNEKLLK